MRGAAARAPSPAAARAGPARGSPARRPRRCSPRPPSGSAGPPAPRRAAADAEHEVIAACEGADLLVLARDGEPHARARRASARPRASWSTTRPAPSCSYRKTRHGRLARRQDPVHHRREPGHRPRDRAPRGARRRERRAARQDRRAAPEAARHGLHRRRGDRGGRRRARCRSSATSATPTRSPTPSSRPPSASAASTSSSTTPARSASRRSSRPSPSATTSCSRSTSAARSWPRAPASRTSSARTTRHILTLSPPINLDPAWLGAHAAYTLSKYGMTLLTLCAAEELREAGVAANTLWPRTIIATAAVQNLLGGDEAMSRARTPRDLRRLGVRDPHQAGARVHRPGADRRRGAGRRRHHRSRALPRRGGRRRADRRPVRGPRSAALTGARFRRAAGMSIGRGSWTGWETLLRRGSLSPCSPPAGRRAWRGRCGCRPSAPPGARSGSGCCCTPLAAPSTTWSSRPPTS